MRDDSACLKDAEHRILKARVAFTLRQPLLATPLLRLRLVPAPPGLCPTMATDGYRILYNPVFVCSLPPDQLYGVLAHELCHVLFAHAERLAGRDHTLWNIAADYAVNAVLINLDIPLPEGALYNRDFRSMTAEAIYDKLLNEATTDNAQSADDGGNTPTEPCPNSSLKDDLIDPNDPRLSSLGEKTVDPEKRERTLCDIRKEFAESLKKYRDHPFAHVDWERLTTPSATIDWRTLLRQHLVSSLKTDWQLWPPSKRHVWRGLYLPSVGQPAPGKIFFVIDTSGSMKMPTIERIFGEIEAFRETFPCPLTVIQADDSVHQVTEYEAYDTGTPLSEIIIGRGGTDFRPAIRWIEDHLEGEHAVLCYLTDGDGTFPESCPIPSIWLITEGGSDPSTLPAWAMGVKTEL